VVSTLVTVAAWATAAAVLFVVAALVALRVRAGGRYRHPVPDVGGAVEQVVVITGCDSGIGRETAQRMARGGFLVLASVFDKKSIAELAREEGTIVAKVADITDGDSVTSFGEWVEDELAVGQRRLAGLLNNAGIVTNAPLEVQPIADVERQLDVNVTGHIRVLQALLPLVRTHGSRIVNLVSIAGRSSTHGLGAYSASKHAMEAVTDTLRLELEPWHISVSAIEPGIIDTPLARSTKLQFEENWDRCYEGARDIYHWQYRKSKAVSDIAMRGSPPSMVADAIWDAFTSPTPRTRYLVGPDARFAAFVRWLLSDHMFEQLGVDIVALMGAFKR